MKKIRRVLSIIIAAAMVMSMSALCFIATAETASRATTQYTFACSMGTTSMDSSTGLYIPPTNGVSNDGHFKIGTISKGKPFKLVEDALVNGWGEPDVTSGPGYTGGHWGWQIVSGGGDGDAINNQIFISTQTGSTSGMDMSPKYLVPAVIMFTAPETGKYSFAANFKVGSAATGVVMTVMTGTYDQAMPIDAPNYYRDTRSVTGNDTPNFSGTVELIKGQTILFIAENNRSKDFPNGISSPEIGINSITVTRTGDHVCSEFEGADCHTEGTCILCGEKGEKDSDNHTQEPVYTDNNNGSTHTVTYNCCGSSNTVAHDFASGDCVCGANNSGSPYVVALTAPAAWVNGSETGTVNLSVKLSSATTEYASGKVVISYNSSYFTFDEVTFNNNNASAGISAFDSQNGELTILIMGGTKTLGEGYNTVVTLPFVATQQADTSTFVLKEAGFSTAKQAESSGLVTARKYSGAVVPTIYSVTLDPAFEGESIALEQTDYTFTISSGNAGAYTVKYAVNGGTPVTITPVGNVYTIPGSAVTGNIVVTAEMAGKISSSEYVQLDNKCVYLILCERSKLPEGSCLTIDVDGDGSAPAAKMFWSGEYNAYCYLVISVANVTDETAAAYTYNVVSSGSAKVIDYGMNVNMTDVVDANDAQLVYNMYNAEYDDFDSVSMEKFLRADVNNDNKVDSSDVAEICGYVCENISAES